MGCVFTLFTYITIFVLCFGVFSLMAHSVKQRTKEIGIRKVLGASAPRILILLLKGFMKWILIANCFAWPVAYFAMYKWLQNFAYRTSLSIWIFILSGLAALAIALLTISYQTIKAATANPVDALKYE
jgi:putative ABC transport system permease protein